MPIYEYKCRDCGETFEQRRSMNQRDNPAKCLKCNKEAVRVVSRTAFMLLGGGWAADGYGK